MPVLPIVCPAACAIAPADDAPSIVCGVLELANQTADGHVSPVFSGTHDAGTVENFCRGDGVPGSMCSYARCAIWRAEREATWERRGLRDDHAGRMR